MIPLLQASRTLPRKLALCALFIRRMSSVFRVEPVAHEAPGLYYKLYGALFFGAVAKIDAVVQAVENAPPGTVVTLDALQLVLLDTSGLDTLRQLHKAVRLHGGTLKIENLQTQPLQVVVRAGFDTELSAPK